MDIFEKYVESKPDLTLNNHIADRLRRLAKLEQNWYKSKAYANAAFAIDNLNIPITEVHNLTDIEGIGKSIAGKINEFLTKGEIQKLNRLEKTDSKTQGVRYSRDIVMDVMAPLINAAKRKHLTFEICGSIRRGKETIKDIDILIMTDEMPQWKAIVDTLDVEHVAAGGKQLDFKLGGIVVNLRSVDKKSQWGAGLLFLTGSGVFNIRLRSIAKKKNMLLNRYGLFDRETNKRIAGTTEESIFKALGEKFIPPNRRG